MPLGTLSVFMVSYHLLGTYLGWDPVPFCTWQAAFEPWIGPSVGETRSGTGITSLECSSAGVPQLSGHIPSAGSSVTASTPASTSPFLAAAFQAVGKLVSMLDSSWPGRHLVALMSRRAEEGSRSRGSACPAPSSLSVLELSSHTHPAPGDNWRPRTFGEAAAPAVPRLPGRAAAGAGAAAQRRGQPGAMRRNAAVGPGPASDGTPEPRPVAFGT